MNILFIGVVVLLVLIFILLAYPKLKLFCIRFLGNKYSSVYINSFKKYYNKSPFGYCIKDEFVYHFLPFFETEKGAKVYKTNQEVSFGNVPFFTEFSRLKREKGKPFCFNAVNLEGCDAKILGYKNYYFDTSTTVLYYFIGNCFFMGEFVFKSPKPKAIDEIVRALSEKYTLHKIKPGKRFYIKRSDNSSIFFHDSGFSVSVSYINLDNEKVKGNLDKVYSNLKSIGEHLESTNYKRHKAVL